MQERELEISLGTIINQAVRHNKGEYFYFDKDGIYKKVQATEALNMLNNVRRREDGSIFSLLPSDIQWNVNINIFRIAAAKMELGGNFDEFRELYRKIQIERHEKPKGLDRFITKIDLPRLARMPENQNKETFDFIYVDVFVITKWESDSYEYILQNKKEITNRVIDKVNKDQAFKKFNVPVNFLKLTKATYSRRKNLIRFVFELKKS